jgi:hypothetical protein
LWKTQKEKTMRNLNLVEDQPHWRVALVALFAQFMGVCIHVEGIPFGSNRSRARHLEEKVGQTTRHSERQATG